MLSVLRHKGVSRKVLWGVAVIIILSFGVFGTAYRLDNTVNSAGNIFGQSISVRDFQQAYYDARDQAIMLYGENFFKMGDKIDLERETFDRLTLLHEINRRGIKVSDAELVAAIAAVPFFQREGKFDKSLYDNIVRNPSIFDRNARDFEEGMRKQLAIRKLMDALVGGVGYTDTELKKEYLDRNAKVKLSYALFAPQDHLKDVSATDEEVIQFYESRKEQFRVLEMISLDYAHLPFPQKAADADKLKVKQEALALSSQAKSEGFEAAAQTHKLEVKTSPFFTMEQPLLTFVSSPEDVEKLFALKPGAYAPPQEMPDGWQIVRLKEKKPSGIPAFEAVKDKAREALLMQKAFEAAKVKADEALTAIQESLKTRDFKATASGMSLKVEETPLFSRGEYIANMGLVAEFQQETKHLSKEKPLSTVVSTSQGAAILYLDDIQNPNDEQFKLDQESFKQQMLAEKRNGIMVDFMTRLRMEAKLDKKIKHPEAKW